MKKLFTIVLAVFASLNTQHAIAQCTAPTNLVSSYANNISTFTWSSVPNATYHFEIAWAGGPWEFGSVPVGVNSYSMTGLMQGGNFQWRVTADCGTSTATSATAFYNSPCNPPFNLTTTNITASSAVLNWMQTTTDNNINTGFSVSYRRANTNNTWIQLTNTTNNPTATFFNLSGLSAGTAYEWRVRRVCSAANSAYLTGSFVTLSCISNGVNSSEWIDLFTLGTINRVSGAEPGGYANVNASTNLVIGSTNNAGQISAGFSGNQRNQNFSVFIDFNRNGSFADAGETLINSGNINNAAIKNFSINIPSNATAGATRMRVIMRRNPGAVTSCITGYNGEAEDYAVNIVTTSSKVITSNHAPSLMSIDEILSPKPNPSSGIFTVAVPSGMKVISYEVINVNGEIVLNSNTVKTKDIRIDITKEPARAIHFKDKKSVGKSTDNEIAKILKWDFGRGLIHILMC